MLVAKLCSPKPDGEPAFHEVRRVGSVQFDDRAGWVLLASPVGSRKADLKWVHPDDTRFEWVKSFNFGECK